MITLNIHDWLPVLIHNPPYRQFCNLANDPNRSNMGDGHAKENGEIQLQYADNDE